MNGPATEALEMVSCGYREMGSWPYPILVRRPFIPPRRRDSRGVRHEAAAPDTFH